MFGEVSMKNFMVGLIGAFIFLPTALLADELDARLNARVEAMREARQAAQGMARHDVQRVLTAAGTPRPTVNTSVLEPKIIQKIETKPDVADRKTTVTQTLNNVITLQKDVKNASEPGQKAALENQLKFQVEKLKVDKVALRKTLIEEARAEVRKASKSRSPAH